MLDIKIKKLTYRLQYRGTKELDKFFSSVSKKLSTLSNDDISLLEQLIEENEALLQEWCSKSSPVPQKYQEIFAKLLT